MVFLFLILSLQYPISALVGNLNISVSLMRIQDCESESTGKCQSFQLIYYYYLSLPKFVQGNTWKASPSAPYLTRSTRHLEGSASHWGGKHPCSVLAHWNKAEGKKEQRINRSTSATDVTSRNCCHVSWLSSESSQMEFSSYHHL